MKGKCVGTEMESINSWPRSCKVSEHRVKDVQTALFKRERAKSAAAKPWVRVLDDGLGIPCPFLEGKCNCNCC